MTHCGKVYVMGGKGKGLENVPPVPLSSETHGFVQASCMDFLGNNQQVKRGGGRGRGEEAFSVTNIPYFIARPH